MAGDQRGGLECVHEATHAEDEDQQEDWALKDVLEEGSNYTGESSVCFAWTSPVLCIQLFRMLPWDIDAR